MCAGIIGKIIMFIKMIIIIPIEMKANKRKIEVGFLGRTE